MTADTTAISLDVIDAALAAAVPGLGEDEQRLAVAVLRLLAAGAPVSIPAAAAAAGLQGPAESPGPFPASGGQPGKPLGFRFRPGDQLRIILYRIGPLALGRRTDTVLSPKLVT